jgi:hypothetical protein
MDFSNLKSNLKQETPETSTKSKGFPPSQVPIIIQKLNNIVEKAV